MKLRKQLPYILIVLIIVVLIITAIYYYVGRGVDTPEVILPSPPAAVTGDPDSSGSDSPLTKAEVTPETVQVVIATLTRAGSYYREIVVNRFSDGQAVESVIYTWVKGSSYRMAIELDGVMKNILVIDDSIWIWYSDSEDYYHGSISSGGYRDADEYMQILTYEDLMAIDPRDISNAGYISYNGVSCVFAEYRTANFGYTTRVYVSVSDGLLMGTEIYDGDELIYSMVSSQPDISTPSDNYFTVPSDFMS